MATMRLDDSVSGCRKFGELGWGPPWAGQEFTTTVRAIAAECAVRASLTEGAFKRADARLCGLWWEILVAAFAIGAQLKHVVFLGVMKCRPDIQDG
jgi:hypothetical protein